MNIRNWLRRHPQPTQVRCYLDNDETKMVPIGDGGRRFRDAEETIKTIEPAKIEALDEDEQVLRAVSFDDPADGATAPAPATEALDTDDPVVRMAMMIGDAYSRGAQEHAAAYKTAFEKWNELLGTLMQIFTTFAKGYTAQSTKLAEMQAAASHEDPAEMGMRKMFEAWMSKNAPELGAMMNGGSSSSSSSSSSAPTNGTPPKEE